MEPYSTLIWAKGTVELKPEATVDVYPAFVVLPRDTEDYLPLRLNDPAKDVGFDIFGMPLDHRAKRIQNLFYGLKKLRLTWITFNNLLINTLYNIVSSHFDKKPPLLHKQTYDFNIHCFEPAYTDERACRGYFGVATMRQCIAM
jgi:hypothetical protein